MRIFLMYGGKTVNMSISKIPGLAACLQVRLNKCSHLLQIPKTACSAGLSSTTSTLDWSGRMYLKKNEDGTADNYFRHLGEQYYDFYKILCQIGNIRFYLTPAQEHSFNDYFSGIHKEYQLRLGEEIIASIRRPGLITFRLAMILSSVRMIDNNSFKTDLECSDDDFNAAMTISEALICHTAFVFSQLPRVAIYKDSGCGQKTVRRQLFLDTLPDEFDRKTFIDISSKLGMPLSTAERNIKKWIEEGFLKRMDFGQYKKCK